MQSVLLMKCPTISLRVAHVECWQQFKHVSYSSLSLETVTGIKMLGKSIDNRRLFCIEAKKSFSVMQPLRNLFEFELIELFFVSERESK